MAVDGSEHSERAVEWAAEQADLEHRRLLAVSAVEWRPEWSTFWPGAMVGGAPVRPDDLERAGRAVADEAAALASRLRPGLAVEAVARVGDPRQVLVDLSADAHLLVMGSRGRGPLRSMLLGSVSSTVVREARSPVVVCRPRTGTAPSSGVVVGADGTPESLPVIRFAFEQASLRGLRLTVLHAYWDAVVVAAEVRRRSESLSVAPELEDLRVVLSQTVAGFGEQFPDVEVSLQLAHGLVDEALGSNRSWDLVVVGRHPVDTVRRVLTGSIANAVLEQAHTTVAMVPQSPVT